MTTPSTDQLRAMPKVELHVHLEGTLGTARIASLAEQHGEPLPRSLDRLFEFSDLDSFLSFLDWTCDLVRDTATAEAVAYEFASRAHQDGTRYAEVIVNPTHWARWDLDDLVPALAAGFTRAQGDGLTDCRLLLSILRAQSGDDALALAEWMTSRAPDRVVGLSIDGNEERAGRTAERFAPAFRRAREAGFGCTAHAGESSGPEGVLDALDVLQVDRIDHGVRAAEDPDLLARLAREEITLDVCLSSNLTILYGSFDEHPIRRLLEAGVPVTLSTDDPAYLGIDLLGEFDLASHRLGWTIGDAAARVSDAIDAAFCEAAKADALREDLDRFLAADAGDPDDAAPGPTVSPRGARA